MQIIEGDITKLDVEVIVNAANTSLWMGSGVAGAIRTAGGWEVEHDVTKKAPIDMGAVVYGTAGDLPYRYIFHAATIGGGYFYKNEDDIVRAATINSLKLAQALDIKSIGLPAFGTGVGGMEIKDCAKVMIDTLRDFEPVPTVLSVFGRDAERVFKKELEKGV